MTTIAERLLLIRGKTKQGDFAQELDINPNTLRSYENGRSFPNQEILERICVQFSVSAEWLLLGRGPMHQNELTTIPNNTSPLLTNTAQCDVDIIMVPMANARLSAGSGSLEIDDTCERKYAFRSDFLFRKGNPDNMILMRVTGDSMSPEIENNDVVLLDQSKKDIVVGTLYAVGFEDAIYLKRIDKLPGKVILKSTNKDYPPVELDINGDCEDLFRVIGRVLWCGREYK